MIGSITTKMFEPLTPRQELEILRDHDRDVAIACCGNDDATFRKYLNGTRKIGRKVALRIHDRFVEAMEGKFGIPEIEWGRPFDELLTRIRRVLVLERVSDRRRLTLELLEDDLMRSTLYHPCAGATDDVALLSARAGQNMASALLLYCWAPHAEGKERENAPELAVSRADTAIGLLERERRLREARSDGDRDLAAVKYRLAYANYNRVALYSEFRATRFDMNGGFSAFTEQDLTDALAQAGEALYDFFLIVKPCHPIKRTLSESMLSIASRNHQLARAGEAWAALIGEWEPARDLRNPESGRDGPLSDDPDMTWIIESVGFEYDDSKFLQRAVS